MNWIGKYEQANNILKQNSLTLVLVGLGLSALFAQIVFGWKDYNSHLTELGITPIGLLQYLGTGHFIQATFENMESEFLQMAFFVLLTVFLYQKGSSESRPLPEENRKKNEFPLTKKSPFPARKGGWILKLYENSLFLVLVLIFVISFFLHAYGSFKNHNIEAAQLGKQNIRFLDIFGQSKFWFESFQNWQSEFISMAAIVFLSVYLRQKGSPQSKPINMPNDRTKD